MSNIKLIIEVTEDYVAYLKDRADNNKASVSDVTILAGKPYEERPQGKWRNLPHKTPLRYKCSICGSLSRIKSLYCPWCGTKMEV